MVYLSFTIFKFVRIGPPPPSGKPAPQDRYLTRMVCAQVLTGQVPFHGLSNSEIATKIGEGRVVPTIPNGLPAGIKSLIKNAADLTPASVPL